MEKSRKKIIALSASGLILSAVAVFYGLLYYFTPYYMEDLFYLGFFLEFNEGVRSFDLDSFFKTVCYIHENDASRIANFIALIFSSSELKITEAVLSGILTAFIFWLMAKMASTKEKWALLPAFIGIFLFLFNRYCSQDFYVLSYTTNYIYSAVLSLCSVILFERADSGRLTNPMMALACVIVFLAGGIHEGFSFPVLGGLGVYALTKRFRLSRKWWILLVFFFLGVMVIATAPCLYERSAYEVNKHDFWAVFNASAKFPSYIALLLVISLVFKKVRETMKRLLTRQSFLVLVVAFILSLLICYMLTPVKRYAWFPTILIIIIAAKTFSEFIPKSLIKIWITIPIGVLAAVLVLYPKIDLLKWVKEQSEEDRYIHQLIDNSKYGTVYYDIKPIPARFAYHGQGNYWKNSTQFDGLNTYSKKGRIQNVLPTSMKGYELGKGDTIPGTAGFVLYNGNLVNLDSASVGGLSWQFNEAVCRLSPYELTTEDGETFVADICQKSFKTEGGNTAFHCVVWKPNVGKIIKANRIQ